LTCRDFSFIVPKLAQRRYAGTVGDAMCGHDDRVVSRVLSSISRSPDDERRMFTDIQDEAQTFVNTYWGEILLVARALFKHGRLDFWPEQTPRAAAGPTVATAIYFGGPTVICGRFDKTHKKKRPGTNFDRS
jgi:hypothetical protein